MPSAENRGTQFYDFDGTCGTDGAGAGDDDGDDVGNGDGSGRLAGERSGTDIGSPFVPVGFASLSGMVSL